MRSGRTFDVSVAASGACGTFGLVGCAAIVVTSAVGTAVHSEIGFVDDTISDLAVGRHAWIQDTGLHLFALGMAAVGAALYRWDLDGRAWRIGCLLLLAVAACIATIALRSEYGDDDPGGFVIHDELVYAVGLFFPAVALLTANGFRYFGEGWFRFNAAVAVLWIVLAPLFFVVPAAWDGLYERLVGLLMIGWLAATSVLLIRVRAELRPDGHAAPAEEAS